MRRHDDNFVDPHLHCNLPVPYSGSSSSSPLPRSWAASCSGSEAKLNSQEMSCKLMTSHTRILWIAHASEQRGIAVPHLLSARGLSRSRRSGTRACRWPHQRCAPCMCHRRRAPSRSARTGTLAARCSCKADSCACQPRPEGLIWRAQQCSSRSVPTTRRSSSAIVAQRCAADAELQHLPGNGAKVGRPVQPWSTAGGHGLKPRDTRQTDMRRPTPGSARLLPSRQGALGTSDRRPTVICDGDPGYRHGYNLTSFCIIARLEHKLQQLGMIGMDSTCM
jgi:hypothetical protein